LEEAILRIAVLEALDALTHRLRVLQDAIAADHNLLAWVQDTHELLFPAPVSASPREKTQSILAQLTYMDGQDPREIIICAGFIGASEATLALAHDVNTHKAVFKKSMLALKKHVKGDVLQKMSIGRLHLKQCYRQIPILDTPPYKLSWTWANTRSIKKISVNEAQMLLLKKGDDLGVQLQLQKLSQHPFHEPLAIVQELAPHLRTNIVLDAHKNPRRLMIKGPLPIFFPCQPTTPYPHFTPPARKKGRDLNRSVRSDVKLDPVPFLPAIRAHRYKEKVTP